MTRLRSLSDDLRSRDDAQLTALLTARPDLLHPVPPNLNALAARAGTSHSVSRALDRLSKPSLEVAEIMAVLPEPATRADVLAARPEPDTEAALDELLTIGLVWGDDTSLHLISAAHDGVGAHPCGLAAPYAMTHVRLARYFRKPKELDALLGEAPQGARDALNALAWGPPSGRVADAMRPVSEDSAKTPIEWLLARDLLIPVGKETVVIPREIALHIRGGRYVRPSGSRPVVEGIAKDPKRIDQTAGQHAFTFVRRLTELLDSWAVSPPGVLRNGGLSVRDLSAAARFSNCEPEEIALIIELSYACGLVATDGEIEESWLPTPAYDLWATRPIAEQWALIARTWLTTSRAPGLVGEKDSNDGRINALSSIIDRVGMQELRGLVLDVLAQHVSREVSEADIVAQIDWLRPRQASPWRTTLIGWILREAEWLGVTGLAALSGPGRALIESAAEANEKKSAKGQVPAALAASIEPFLPTPVDHVLLQADLTAIAPGPLEHSVARQFALMANVESTGGATVYRFTDESIRRGLDAGSSTSDLLSYLEKHSRTPIPQPLTYLIEDVSRRHGAVRVGNATSYIRSDDETALTAMLADRKCAGLGLVRIAPTVVIARAPIDEVIAALRASGLAPMPELADGTIVVRRPDERRTPPRSAPPRLAGDSPATGQGLIAAAVKALRAGERAVSVVDTDSGERVPRLDSTTTLNLVREAVQVQQQLWIGFADTGGTSTVHIIDPIRLNGGVLTAFDHRSDEVRTFAVSRITGVRSVDPD